MPRIRRFLVAALALPACATFTTPAMAGNSHYLGVYKVEKHVDFEGEGGPLETISCRPGDIALDGMWRIDAVDQDNDYVPAPPPGFGTTGNLLWDNLESVLTVTARRTALGTYSFAFLPFGGGDSQGKLFLTCLPQPTLMVNGHSHTWTVGPLQTNAAVPVAGPGLTTHATTPDCAVNEIAIAPGFDWAAGGARGNVSRRWPSTTAVRGWDWSFVSDDVGAIDVSWACLALKSNAGGSPAHKHRIIKQFRSTTQLVVQNSPRTYQVHCGDLY
jgi:hypothetical protein